MVRKKTINELAVREKIDEFRITLQKLYLDLTREAYYSVQAMHNYLRCIVTKSALAISGKIVRRDTSKLSQEMNEKKLRIGKNQMYA